MTDERYSLIGVRGSDGLNATGLRRSQSSVVAVVCVRFKRFPVGVGHRRDERLRIVSERYGRQVGIRHLAQPPLTVVGIREGNPKIGSDASYQTARAAPVAEVKVTRGWVGDGCEPGRGAIERIMVVVPAPFA